MSSSPLSSFSRSKLPSYALPAFFLALSQASSAAAYSWAFQSPPKQCGSVTVSITGDDGRPPYRILIVPDGPSPLSTGVEVRKILDVAFDEGQSSVSFHLPYPARSKFIAVVSDANGFGTGGTSGTVAVGEADDDSCFDANVGSQVAWYFSILPANQIVTCQDTRIFWTPSTVVGSPTFQGIIPGGQSFTIPQGRLSTIDGQGTGFTWNANLRNGLTLHLVGSDDRGFGTGGSVSNVVSAGTQPNSSCLNASSPSSTPEPAAGGSYPTETGNPGDDSNNGTSGGGGGGSNIGGIVGGVVGGIVAILALLLLLYFLRRRSREKYRHREKPLDLLNEEEDGEGSGDRASRNDLPQFYQPEPFTVPDPTIAGSVAGDTESVNGSRRPLSGGTMSTSFYTSQRPGTPDGSQVLGAGGQGSTTTRKGAPPRTMRPVNIIQHDDAGPSYPPPEEGQKEGEVETIELPPAYTALRKEGESA